MHVVLICPPQWTAAHPSASTAVLAGQLRHAGHRVSIRDFNLEFYDFVVAPRTTAVAWERAKLEHRQASVEGRVGALAVGAGAAQQTAHDKAAVIAQVMARFHDGLDESRRRWAAAPDVLRSAQGFYDPRAYERAYAAIDEALDLFSVSFFPSRVTWNAFWTPSVTPDLEPILAFCRDPVVNPFHPFFEHRVDELLDLDARLYSISITASSQLLPALTLALMLKERLAARKPGGHVSLGGNNLSRIKQTLLERPEFFRHFADSVSVASAGQAELAIRALAAAVRDDGSVAMAETRSTLYVADDGTVRETPEERRIRLDDTAFMDLAGFPLRGYHAPETVACVRASQGCYYGKCEFCDGFYGLEDDEMQIERLVAEVRHLRDHYGVRHLEFIDQAISPARMRLICDAFVAADLGVRWFCNARTDPGFDRQLFLDMRRAGATMIMWGIESGSARLLKLMKKGVVPERRLPLLREAAAAGLWNFAYVFFGFPTETEDEAQETIDFICHNTDAVHAYGRSTFMLGKHSPLMNHLDEFGISYETTAAHDFASETTVDVRFGLQGDALTAVSRRCSVQALAAYGGDPLWMRLRSRETLHLYLAHHGPEFLRSWRGERAAAEPAGEERFIF